MVFRYSYRSGSQLHGIKQEIDDKKIEAVHYSRVTLSVNQRNSITAIVGSTKRCEGVFQIRKIYTFEEEDPEFLPIRVDVML